jgi:hypothetical protein
LEELFKSEEHYTRIRFEDLFGLEGPKILHGVLSFIGIPYRDEYAAVLQKRENISSKTYFPNWDAWKPEQQRQLWDICGTKMEQYGYL